MLVPRVVGVLRLVASHKHRFPSENATVRNQEEVDGLEIPFYDDAIHRFHTDLDLLTKLFFLISLHIGRAPVATLSQTLLC